MEASFNWSFQTVEDPSQSILHDIASPFAVILVPLGFGVWQMAAAAQKHLEDKLSGGVVITKYEHARGAIGNLAIFEAGHPVPDENSYRAAQAAIGG